MVNNVDPDSWQTGIAVSTALLSIMCITLSKVMQVIRKSMSVFTSVGSEKFKTMEKGNVHVDLW